MCDAAEQLFEMFDTGQSAKLCNLNTHTVRLREQLVQYEGVGTAVSPSLSLPNIFPAGSPGWPEHPSSLLEDAHQSPVMRTVAEYDLTLAWS